MPPEPAVVGEDVAAFLRGGVVIVVATRDEDLRPEITRAWGPDVAADGRSVTLCLVGPPGSRVRANLEANGAVAATFTLPTSYRSVQIKGTAADLRAPNEEELARSREHAAAFAAEAVQVGVAPRLAPRFAHPPDLALTLVAEELYDQTPGPAAGERL